MATKVAPKVKPKVIAPKVKASTITDPVSWAVAVIQQMNEIAKAEGKKTSIPITTKNVETLLRPMTGEGSVAQQGGFLRDNNPWNIGTGCTATGAYGGVPKAPYGPDARCGGGPVYLNTFATPLAGARATAEYLTENGAFNPMVLNASSALVLKKTWYASDSSAAPAANVTGNAVTTAARNLGTTAAPTKETKAIATAVRAEAVKNAHGLKVPSLTQVEDALAAGKPPTGWNATQWTAVLKASTPKIESIIGAKIPQTGLGIYFSNFFQSGASNFVPTATAAVSAVSNATGITAVGDFFSKLTNINWARVGIFLGGGTLLAVGLFVFVATSKTGKTVESAAMGAL